MSVEEGSVEGAPIIYEVFVELLQRLEMVDLIAKLPKCNCKYHEKKAEHHHKYSDVGYTWVCPVHGDKMPTWIEETLKRG